jgi:hypothetical protein
MDNGNNNFTAEELMRYILIDVKQYNRAIKDNRPFSEAKKIRLEIKKLTFELQELLGKAGRPERC